MLFNDSKHKTNNKSMKNKNRASKTNKKWLTLCEIFGNKTDKKKWDKRQVLVAVHLQCLFSCIILCLPLTRYSDAPVYKCNSICLHRTGIFLSFLKLQKYSCSQVLMVCFKGIFDKYFKYGWDDVSVCLWKHRAKEWMSELACLRVCLCMCWGYGVLECLCVFDESTMCTGILHYNVMSRLMFDCDHFSTHMNFAVNYTLLAVSTNNESLWALFLVFHDLSALQCFLTAKWARYNLHWTVSQVSLLQNG